MLTIKKVNNAPYKPLRELIASSEPKVQQSAATEGELVALALDMCRWKDPDLLGVIQSLDSACGERGTSLESALSAVRGHGEAPLISLLRAGNHAVLRVLHRGIANGWPIPGEVERTAEFLRIRTDASQDSWGFQIFGKGCTYVGTFFGDQRHGYGKIQYGPDWSYTGEFLSNQKHGLGVDLVEGLGGRRRSGIYIDNLYRGNPQPCALQAPKPWYRRFSRG